MIQLFMNEYMLHPVGMEMSQNACGHNCFYCFATLKNSKRKFDSKRFANQMNNIDKSDTFLAKKIRDKYPFVFSNNTDPFASNNIRLTREMLPILIEKEIPIFFQTKTGNGMYDVIKDVPPSVFYMSVTMLDDVMSRRVERQAPLPSERLEAIDMLQEMGHHVIVGINPLCKEWLPEPDFVKLIEILTSKGVKAFPVGGLYFRKQEVEKIAKFDKGGIYVQDYVKNKNVHPYLQHIIKNYHNYGLITPCMPFYCEGMKHFLPTNYKKVATIFDFINHIIDTHGKNVVHITFNDFFEFFNKCNFIEEGFKLDQYVFGIATKLWIGKPENQNVMTKEHFYRIIWNAENISQNLSSSLFFQVDGKDNDGNKKYLYDGGQLIINWERFTLT